MTAGYRGDGLRAWKQTSSSRTYFIYDGTSIVAELDSSGTVSAMNTSGAAGLVSRRTGAQSIFYTFDPQGSVSERLDSAGGVMTVHLFTAHGAELTAQGAGPYGYKARWGYYSDRETGLQLLTHRYYDSQSGRFLTRDPIGYQGGINLYSYVRNNSVGLADPTGLYPSFDDGVFGTPSPLPHSGTTPNYLNIQASGGLYFGAFGGVIIAGDGFYPYLGAGQVIGCGVSITGPVYPWDSPSVTEGWNTQVAGCAIGCASLGGSAEGGEPAVEVGAAVPTKGIAAGPYYVFSPIRLR